MKIVAHAGQEAAVPTPDGAQRRVLSYGGHMMLVQFEFPANVASWSHSHPHEQVGYVVSGEIDLVMEGHQTEHLQAGSSYYVPSNVKHNIITHAPSVLIDCFTPIREDFLKS